MSAEEFLNEMRGNWQTAIVETLGDNPPVSATWQGYDSILTALRPFIERPGNYAHLPPRGGCEIEGIAHYREWGCFKIHAGKGEYCVAKPKALVFEHFPDSPIDSFLLLRLAPLYRHAELLDCEPDADLEVLFRDEAGRYVREWNAEGNSRLVIRCLRGQILIVSKGSAWDGCHEVYDGRHNEMPPTEIRQFIIDRRRRLLAA